MRRIRSWLCGLSLGVAAHSPASAQARLRPTILVDGHVALDTILSLAMAKSIQATLTDLLRGTGVGVASLFAPSADMPGSAFTGEISEVLAAEKIHDADIVVELNAAQSQNGNIFLAPIYVPRHSPQVDLAPVSGLTMEAIARTIAARIAKDTTRIRRIAEEDARRDSTATGVKPP